MKAFLGGMLEKLDTTGRQTPNAVSVEPNEENSRNVLERKCRQVRVLSDHEEEDDYPVAPEDSHDIEENVHQKSKVQETRHKWALFHFYALRPAFSVSLLLYLASLTSSGNTPTFHSGVINPVQRLATLIQMESRAYTKCIHQWTSRTTVHLQEYAIKDREHAGGLLKSNRELIQQAEDNAGKHFQYAQKARQSLMQWRKDDMEISWRDVIDDGILATNSSMLSPKNSTCTKTKHNQTQQLLGKDYQDAENQVNKLLENFMSESHNSLRHVTDYAMERFEYDRNYFILQRIQPALEYLAEHSPSIQAVSVDLNYNITAIELEIQGQLQTIWQVIEKSRDQIAVLQGKLEEFRDSINGLHTNYNKLYNRMVNAAETLYEFLPPGVSMPNAFDLSDFPLADSFLPVSGLTWSELEMELGDIEQIFQNAVKACSKILGEVLENAQVQTLQGLHEALQNLSQTLMEILELKNYHPPAFQGSRDGIVEVDHELDFNSQRGQEVLNKTAKAMIDFRSQSSIFDGFATSEFETPRIGRFDYNYTKEKSTTFELFDILVPPFSFLKSVLAKIALLGNYAFLLDILCGFIQWWKLSSMYAKGALPNMPVIDYGTNDDQESEERPQTSFKIVLFIAKSLMNPLFMGFICILSFIASIVIIFWIPHVQEMCVQSAQGTWFANNMLGPALTNMAMTNGNAQYLLAEQHCYSSQSQLCARIVMDTETQIAADKAALESFQVQQKHSMEALELMEECIDTSTMTKMVTDSCCGLKGYSTVDCLLNRNYTCPIDFTTTPPSAYRPFSTYLDLSHRLEHLDKWALNDEMNECPRLKEACYRVQCSGVNDEWIQEVANQTDCKVELWIIEACKFWVIFVIQFVAWYVTCSLIYFGCRDLNWRKLCPDSIGLHTHLLEGGELAKGKGLHERSEQISKEIQWFERKAKLQILLGFILLTIYIVAEFALIFKT